MIKSIKSIVRVSNWWPFRSKGGMSSCLSFPNCFQKYINSLNGIIKCYHKTVFTVCLFKQR